MILDKPGYQTSIHVNIYLHTAGKESAFMEDLALLEDTLDELAESYPDSVTYIRGDANACIKPRLNNTRDSLFGYFLSSIKLEHVLIEHPTYHHFTNDGKSDSNLDVLLSSKVSSEGYPNTSQETLLEILCGKTNCLIDSSHDALFSTVSFSCISQPSSSFENISAPRIKSTKHKIIWSEEGITEYQELLANTLPALQDDFSGELQRGSASVLFQMTNHIMTSAAKLTNKPVYLSNPLKQKKPYTPSEIKDSLINKNKAHNALLATTRDINSTKFERTEAGEKFRLAKSINQNLVRKHNVESECKINEDFDSILDKNPNHAFKIIKSQKAKDSPKLKHLKVEDKVYNEETVADGFFDSIKNLKTAKNITASCYESFAEDHSEQIPRLSFNEAEKLLRKIRPSVSDFFSITAAHYLNRGHVAILHFQFLLNKVLENIEIAAIDELNTAHAIVLHKGHNKDKNSSSSYRTISTCPFIAKAADIYLGQLSKDDWKRAQAATQFQGEGMSHELAALLLTTTIHHSLSLKKAVFLLLLDAKSAFDLVMREILVRRLYLDTKSDQKIRYWDLRLSCRTTYCQWDDSLMGPINDQVGVEQGGPNSTDFYKEYNNDQASSAQESGLGTTIHDIPVASDVQAYDTDLTSNDAFQHLLQLDVHIFSFV